MRRYFFVALLVIMTLGMAAPASAHQGGHGPCTGGTPVALSTPPGPGLGEVTSTAASDPGSFGFPDTATLVAFVHGEFFCDSNTPGGG